MNSSKEAIIKIRIFNKFIIKMLKIALAQINSCVGDLNGNFRKIVDNIKKAKNRKVDIVVFPELALCGYPPEDLLLKSHFVEENIKYLQKIKTYTTDIIAIVGFVDREEDKIYNAYAIFQDGRVKTRYHKIYLPNYGVFDEKRYFTPGEEIYFYSLGDYTFVVNICEDIWEEKYVNQLKEKKLDFIINISASPYHLGKFSLRRKILSRASKELDTFLFYCNLVGGQDELIFDGTSMVFSSTGELVGHAKRFEEDFYVFPFDRQASYSPKEISSKEEEKVFKALRLGVLDYVRKNGFKKVIVGVSGGIDSAVVTALATFALGKRNVKALIMPSPYTSKETFRDAKKICDNLGIQYFVVDIGKIYESYLRALDYFFKGKKRDKTEENIQARIRGNILMAFSNKFGYLVLNTGNKSEVSCGYCTLYGDMVGGFGVLKDVHKLMVYKIAYYINKISKKAVIPHSVIKRPPSAELKPNQRDTDALPPYHLLDPILKLYVEDDCSLGEIVNQGFKRSLVKKVIRLVDFNEYKRRQAPVGIKITPRAFGKDRRMPITNKFMR